MVRLPDLASHRSRRSTPLVSVRALIAVWAATFIEIVEVEECADVIVTRRALPNFDRRQKKKKKKKPFLLPRNREIDHAFLLPL